MRNRYKRDVNRLIDHPRRKDAPRDLRNPGPLDGVFSSAKGLPRQPPPPYKRVTLAAGQDHFVCVMDDGSLYVSGYYDFYGVMSDKPAGTDFVSVAAGNFGAMALKQDGSVVVWGDTDYDGGQTGTPGAAVYGIRDVPAGLVAKDIAMSMQSAAAIMPDGEIIVWGGDNEGEITNKPSGTGWKTIMGADFNFIAVHDDGSVATWGYVPTGGDITPPVGLDNCVMAWAADRYFWALKADDTFVGWATEANTYPGDPTMLNPIWIRAGVTAFNAVAIDRDGNLEQFGTDTYSTGVLIDQGITDAVIGDTTINLQMAVRVDGTFSWWGDTSNLTAPSGKVKLPTFGWI